MSIKLLQKRRDSLLKKIFTAKSFIDGSVVAVRRRCGNKSCSCVTGEKHLGYYLQFKVKKVTKAVYIPVDILDEVISWSNEYKRIKKIIHEICETQKSIIKSYVSEKRAGKL